MHTVFLCTVTHFSVSLFVLSSTFCIPFHIFHKLVLEEFKLASKPRFTGCQAWVFWFHPTTEKLKFQIRATAFSSSPLQRFYPYQRWVHVSTRGSKSTLQTCRQFTCKEIHQMLAGQNFFTPSFIQLTSMISLKGCTTPILLLAEWCELTQWNFLIQIKEITHWIPASVKSIFQRAVNCCMELKLIWQKGF